jgi:hypothetical protein
MCQGLDRDSSTKVVVVGTYKDVYEAMKYEETIDIKNQKFKSDIPSEIRVYTGKVTSKVIFEVNTSLPVEQNEDIARVIRQKITESGESKKMPISWYVLQIVLENLASNLHREVFSISDCEHVAEQLGIKSDEMKAALQHFDHLNLFFYKEHILPGVVFTSSQVPLSAVSQLVEKRYHLLDLRSKGDDRLEAIDGEWWLHFLDQAKISLQVLQDSVFQKYYHRSAFTKMHLLHLLKELLIVAPVNSQGEYFCPSLLEMVKGEEVDGFLRDPKRVTRVVHFSSSYAPPGVFCCAVCYLGSKAGWKIRVEDTFKRNQITFAAHGKIVTLIDKFRFFAVSVARGDVKTVGEKIAQDVFAALTHGLKTTHKEAIGFEFSFLCQCTDHEDLHPATAQQEEEGLVLLCSREELTNDPLDKEQEIWHNCSGTSCYPSGGRTGKPGNMHTIGLPSCM